MYREKRNHEEVGSRKKGERNRVEVNGRGGMNEGAERDTWIVC